MLFILCTLPLLYSSPSWVEDPTYVALPFFSPVKVFLGWTPDVPHDVRVPGQRTAFVQLFSEVCTLLYCHLLDFKQR